MGASISCRGRRALATAAVLAFGLAAAPSAMAGEASVTGTQAQFDAYLGEANSVTVTQLLGSPTRIRMTDVVSIDTDGGCLHPNPNSSRLVECGTGITSVKAFLGNQADRFAPALGAVVTLPMSVQGNPGDDDITTGNGADVIDGGDHRDTLRGGAGADQLLGGGNDDLLIGGTGPDKHYGQFGDDTLNADDNAGGDHIDCGPGFDFAVYNEGDIVSNDCEQTQEA